MQSDYTPFQVPHQSNSTVTTGNGYTERHRTIGDILESEEDCRAILEAARWPGGPVCPNCGAEQAASRLTTRPGLWTCKACRASQYSVTSGTQLHRSRLPVSAWVRLYYLTRIRGQQLSNSQVSRKLSVAYLTARSMLERLDAMERDQPDMARRLYDQLYSIIRRGAES